MTQPLLPHSSIVGGSTAARRIYCPGSYKLEEPFPSTSSEFAEVGTALHETMEYILLECDDTFSPNDLLGMVFNNITITQTHIDDKIKPALKAFKEIVEHAGGDLDYLVEVRANMDAVIPGAFGTVDILGRGRNGKVYVLDWKFGDGVPVNVEGNMQLAFYAAAAMYDNDDDELIEFIGGGAIDFVFGIIQPRRADDGDDYQLWETNSGWVEDFVDLLVPAVETAQKPDAPVKMGSHCRFCKAEAICPAKLKTVGQAAGVAPQGLNAVELGKYVALADDVEQWVKAVHKLAHEQLERGVAVPGYKLVPKRSTRKYNDVEKARGVLVRQLKTEAAHKPREIITPAQAEKKLGKEKYSKLLEKYVSMISSGNTLAPDSDSRPDVSDTLTQLAEKAEPGKGTLFDT